MIRVLEFKTEYRANKEPIHWVKIAPIGADFERTQTWKRVKSLKPDENANETIKASLTYKDMEARWSIIGPAYDRWLNGQEIPETGTPLAAWSGVTPEQVEFLKHMGVLTVEDVRDMGDATIEKIRFPNARKLPSLARSWLDGEQAAEKDAKIADLEEKMKAMTELLEEQMKTNQPPKRGPGRPRKQETEAA